MNVLLILARTRGDGLAVLVPPRAGAAVVVGADARAILVIARGDARMPRVIGHQAAISREIGAAQVRTRGEPARRTGISVTVTAV